MRVMPRLAAAVAVVAAVAAMGLPSAPAQAAACTGVTFGAAYSGSYVCNSLGSITDQPTSYGGITFLDNNTLLVAGDTLDGGGVINQVGIVRDSANHIIAFSGPATSYAAAPNIDGGLAFGPGGVLFYTTWPSNTLGQIKPGSTSADRVVSLPNGLASVGSLVFVPPGFAGAGGMKLLSYGNGAWYDATLTADGDGTYAVAATPDTTIAGGPEGAVYVAGANAGFDGTDSVIVTDYANARLTAYQVDADGNPIVGSAAVFLSGAGLGNAEGGVIDPLTGDELLSVGGDQIIVISGFLGTAVPEPASLALFGAGVAVLGALRRHRG